MAVRPTPTAIANLAAEGVTDGVSLVGDVLQDLAARTAAEVADPAVLLGIEAALRGDAPGLRLAPGEYLLATVHRAANRDAAALRSWAHLLGAVARPERPVILPLHPGTAVALASAGIEVPEVVRVVPPVGYRTSLALQLHAAAVLTDSGGVQREAAWLGVPCLVLRDVTEWTEAVADSGGLMVTVGLDAERARAMGGSPRRTWPRGSPPIGPRGWSWRRPEPPTRLRRSSSGLGSASRGEGRDVRPERHDGRRPDPQGGGIPPGRRATS